MARDENAVLAVRICGLAYAAWQLRALVWFLASVWPSLDVRGPGGAFVMYLFCPVLGIVAGVAIAFLAPGVSRLAAPPAQDGEAAVREPLRLAVLVIGIVYALAITQLLPTLPQMLAAGRHGIWNPWVPVAGAVLLLAWPGPVVGFMQRRAGAGPPGGFARVVVGAGLGIVGLWLLFPALTSLTFNVESLILKWGDVPQSVLVKDSVASGLEAAMAAAMVWWSGRIARLLPAGECEPPAAAGPAACVCAAVILIGFYEAVLPLARYWPWAVRAVLSDASPMVNFGLVLALKVTFVVGTAWLTRAAGWWLARCFYAGPAGPETAQTGAIGILQVGLILVSVDVLLRSFMGNIPSGDPRWWSVLVGLALLAFWAELSRWFLKLRRPDGEGLRDGRAAALRPWLVLLGFWVGIRPLAHVIGWVLGKVPGLLPPVVLQAGTPHVKFHVNRVGGGPLLCLAGLLLVLLAAPLARWLARDSLFGRWWKLGWASRAEP